MVAIIVGMQLSNPLVFPSARSFTGFLHGFAAVLAAGTLLLGGPSAVAQTGSAAQGPLRLVVPFTPGTGIDLIARTVGPRLAERLGRAVVVDNRVGASGNLGTEAVVRAAPNGATLLVSVNTLVMNRSLYPGLSFDPVRDLVPVSLTSWGQSAQRLQDHG